MIERQIERLAPEDRQMLEVASVAGLECATVAVAAGVQAKVEKVEERCEALAQRGQFLHAAGTEHWPDGTVSGRYRFIHALYQAVLYDRVAASRRVRLHRMIGERVEAGYGERAGEIAGELALHFERGQEKWRAVQWQAAEATRRSAPREAIHHVRSALALLATLPETPERAEQELRLQLALAEPLIATTGFAAPEVEAVYTRARELCQQLGDPPQLFSVLFGLMAFYLIRGELALASAQGEHLLHLAEQGDDSTLLLLAHTALGVPAMNLGAFATAFEHLSLASGLYDPQRHHVQIAVHGLDPGVLCRIYTAFSLLCLGYPDQARHRSKEALALAFHLTHPYTTALALTWAAMVHYGCGEAAAAQELAQAVLTLAHEQGFPYWNGAGRVIQGWALAMQGQGTAGCEQIHQGLRVLRETGAIVAQRLGAALLAEAYGEDGKMEEGLATVNEVLRTLDQPGERLWDAELYRLKGELMLQQQSKAGLGQVSNKSRQVRERRFLTPNPQSEAEACFLKAIEIARHQGAKLGELRAVTSLARLWQQQGKGDEAWQMLADVYNWFTEGFDTKDLQEAKGLIEGLSH